MDNTDENPNEYSELDWQSQQIAEMIVDASENDTNIETIQLEEYMAKPPKKIKDTSNSKKRQDKKKKKGKNNY